MSALTSYFCLFSFSLRSNFSASSCIIHCQSSLAFSLREPIRSFVSGHSHTTSWPDCDDLLQFIFRQMIDVEWLPSVCQDLLLLLSLRLFLRPLAALTLQEKIDSVWFIFTWYCCSSFIKKNVFPNAWYNDNIHRNLLIQTFCWMPPNWCVLLVSTFFFLASSSCFFLCSSCSLLSFSSWWGMMERVFTTFLVRVLEVNGCWSECHSRPDGLVSLYPSPYGFSAAPLSRCDASPAQIQHCQSPVKT